VKPLPVASLRAVDTPNDDGGSITLTWTPSLSDKMLPGLTTSNAGYVMVPGVLNYGIYRKLQSEADFTLIGTVKAGATTYADASVVSGPSNTYAYEVRAMDASNESDPSETYKAFAAKNVDVPVGDWTSDQVVDLLDFRELAKVFGKSTDEVDPMFDLNGDGMVDLLDFREFAKYFGTTTATAKPVPVAFGRNAGAELSLSVLDATTADLAVQVSLDKAVELVGYSFTVHYDPATLRFERAGEGNLLTSNAPFLVLSNRAGELTIAHVLSSDDAVAGQGLVANLFFTSKDEVGGGEVRLSEGTVLDANYGTNAVVLRSESVVAKPKAFALLQNHPNPFNPATTIGYALPQAASVRLEVCNMLGQVIATLVNEKQDMGRYSVRWDGLNSNGEVVGSGVYFYRIVADDFHAVQSMLLVK